MDTPLKACKDCKQFFPATPEYFQPHKKVASGIGPRCRACYLIDHAKAMENWRQKNPERSKEYQRQWVNENRERYQEVDRARYKRDAEKRKQWQRDYRKNSADAVKKTRKRTVSKNRDAVYLRILKREDKKRGLFHAFTVEDWKRCLEYFGHRCAVCGRPRGFWHTLAQDHWVPVTSPNCPGSIPSNIVPLCHGNGGCNNSKSNRDALEWIRDTHGKRKGKEIFDRIEAYLTQLKPPSQMDDPS